MKKPNRSGTIVAAVLLSIGSVGCDRSASSNIETTKIQPVSVAKTLARSDTTRASIVAEAESLYTFGRERQPVTVTDREFKGPYVPNDSVPRMTIATASLKDRASRPRHRIIARIRSERAYPAMGIVAGYNYVWRNSWDRDAAANWVTRIVPSDTAARMHLLTRDARRREFTHGMSPQEPRLVRIKVHSMAIGACLDDPVCPTGHCGYY